MSNDRRFEALSLVLKHDGLKLLVMIRLCPLPYSISNGAISTFPTVSTWTFALATAAATPKLFGAIFIGSRLAVIAKSGEKMDAATKAINWISIVLGVILGGLTGLIIYKRYITNHGLWQDKTDKNHRTLARSRQIEAEQRANSRVSNRQTGEFSDDADRHTATATLITDDQIDFLDQDATEQGYRDEYTDDEDDVFRYGDGDEEEGSIGLDKQPAQR